MKRAFSAQPDLPRPALTRGRLARAALARSALRQCRAGGRRRVSRRAAAVRILNVPHSRCTSSPRDCEEISSSAIAACRDSGRRRSERRYAKARGPIISLRVKSANAASRGKTCPKRSSSTFASATSACASTARGSKNLGDLGEDLAPARDPLPPARVALHRLLRSRDIPGIAIVLTSPIRASCSSSASDARSRRRDAAGADADPPSRVRPRVRQRVSARARAGAPQSCSAASKRYRPLPPEPASRKFVQHFVCITRRAIRSRISRRLSRSSSASRGGGWRKRYTTGPR
jgi:hypothetical protein